MTCERRVGVDVIDPAPQPLGRLLPTQGGAFSARALEGGGRALHFETTAQSVTRTDTGLAIALASVRDIETGLVLSASVCGRVSIWRVSPGWTSTAHWDRHQLQASAADV